MCDISNIAHHNKRNDIPSLKNIDLLFSKIPEEYEIVGIADCSLYHQINDKKRYKTKYLISKMIYEAPAGIEADDFILSYAKENGALILSNDRFRQYNIVSEDWLREHQIRFMIIENHFYFEQRFVKLIGEVLNETTLELNKILKEKQSIEG